MDVLGAVPWAPIPFEPYVPAPLPEPTASPAPLCRLQDLIEQPVTAAAATGNEAIVLNFLNHTSHACLAGGYPHVVLSQPGLPAIVPGRGGFWDQHPPTSDLHPGASASFAVGFALDCGRTVPSPVYKHLTVTLPGGGTSSQVLTGVAPYGGGEPLAVFAQCGVAVTEFAVPASQPVFLSDPLAALTSTIRAPSAVKAGTTITYVISLDNPGTAAVALTPCRGYFQTLDRTKSPSFAYQLHCSAAGPITPDGSESFVMEMPTSGVTAGRHLLCWSLDKGANTGPPSCTSVRIVN